MSRRQAATSGRGAGATTTTTAAVSVVDSNRPAQQQPPPERVARYDATTHCVVFADDGSAANVPAGQSPGTVPNTYVEFARHESFKGKGDPMAIAATHWQDSLAWRATMSDILRRPPPQLRQMERLQPMYLHGLSKDGHLVMYEVMREADFDAMFQNGLTVDHHVERAVYMTEFLRHELCRGTGRYYDPTISADSNNTSNSNSSNNVNNVTTKDFSIVYVKDMAELDIAKYFAGQALLSRTKYFDLARIHYPGSLQHAFCLHLPRWMASMARTFLKAILWGFPAPELLFLHNYQQRMLEVIDADQIPVSYGGTSPYKLGEHPLHLRYLAFTEHYLQLQQQGAATSMMTTTPILPAISTTTTIATITTSSEVIGSPCSEEGSVEAVSKSSSSSSASTFARSSSLESTPAPGLRKVSSISLSEHDHADDVEVLPPPPQQQDQQRKDDTTDPSVSSSSPLSSVPTAASTTTSSTNPLTALVATVWLGVWTFWSVIHSLVVSPPSPQQQQQQQPPLGGSHTTQERVRMITETAPTTTTTIHSTSAVESVSCVAATAVDGSAVAQPQEQPQQAVESTTVPEPSVTSSLSKRTNINSNKRRFSLSGRRRQTKNDPSLVTKKKFPLSFRRIFRSDRSFETADGSIL